MSLYVAAVYSLSHILGIVLERELCRPVCPQLKVPVKSKHIVSKNRAGLRKYLGVVAVHVSTQLVHSTRQTMRARGQCPTQHTTGAFLDALKRNRETDRCVSVYADLMDSGVDLGDVCFNIVVSALVQV